MPNRCRSICFTFLTDGYAFIRLVGVFHIPVEKNRVSHILFLLKKKKTGLIIYLAALKKGAIRHAHPYYIVYRKLPPFASVRIWPKRRLHMARHIVCYDIRLHVEV